MTMHQTGTLRRYVSPPLDSNGNYCYQVRVRWRDEHGRHDETRQVPVAAGAVRRVNFNNQDSLR
jgi:uncharacterized protein (TIGR03000 family)